MDDPFTYFGLWSARDVRSCSELLTSLGVRHHTTESKETQDDLENWHAWDPECQNPNVGFNLWIHREDLEKLGDQLVKKFPERQFKDGQ
jgi:hypothetical protein